MHKVVSYAALCLFMNAHLISFISSHENSSHRHFVHKHTIPTCTYCCCRRWTSRRCTFIHLCPFRSFIGGVTWYRGGALFRHTHSLPPSLPRVAAWLWFLPDSSRNNCRLQWRPWGVVLLQPGKRSQRRWSPPLRAWYLIIMTMVRRPAVGSTTI